MFLFIISVFLFVGETSATVGGECPRQWGGNVHDSAGGGGCPRQWGGGDVHNSGEIEHGLGNSRLEIAIHNFA